MMVDIEHSDDMDAQVANVLLVGGGARLARDRSQDLAIYDRDRLTADQDLQQAAVTEADNPSAQRQLRSVLDGVGQYEALAAEAILADQADVLPAVASLTSVSATELDATYSRGRTAALTGILVITVTGLAALVVLVALQAYLAVRYRRLTNPPLIVIGGWPRIAEYH